MNRPVKNESVILLHGLIRSSASFNKMAADFRSEGYHIVNVDYPSRQFSIEELASKYIGDAIDECLLQGSEVIHFVTHSMGGILVRYYLSKNTLNELGHVVMLGPPNQGSELVDKLGGLPGFSMIHGPAGIQLGTSRESVPAKLGKVDYPVGVIAGNRSINMFLSMIIPGEDDGKVSVERTRLTGMTDFLVVPHTHPMMMRSNEVITQVKCFLEKGMFSQ